MVKNPSAMRETQVWSLGQEDPLQKSLATHSSTLAWRIPWTEKPGGLQSMSSQLDTTEWLTLSLSQQTWCPWPGTEHQQVPFVSFSPAQGPFWLIALFLLQSTQLWKGKSRITEILVFHHLSYGILQGVNILKFEEKETLDAQKVLLSQIPWYNTLS